MKGGAFRCAKVSSKLHPSGERIVAVTVKVSEALKGIKGTLAEEATAVWRDTCITSTAASILRG